MRVRRNLQRFVGATDWVLGAAPLSCVLLYLGIDAWDLRLGSVPAAAAQWLIAILSVLAMLAAWHARMRVRRFPDLQRAWNLLTLGLALSAATRVLIVVAGMSGVSATSPWITSFALLSYLPLFLGLVGFPPRMRSHQERLKLLLDMTAVAIGSLMLYAHFSLPALLGSSRDGQLPLMGVGFTLADVMLIVGASAVLLRHPPRGHQLIMGLAVVSIASQLIADTIVAFEWRTGAFRPGGPAASFWAGTYYLACIMAMRERRIAARVMRSQPEARVLRDFSLLPYAGALVGYALLLFVALRENSTELSILVWGAVLLTAMIAFRQFVVVRENGRLVAERIVARGEQRFRSLIQNSSDVLMIIDEAGLVQYASPSVERVFGNPADAWLGSPIRALVHDDDVAAVDAALRAAQPNLPLQVEWRMRHSNGQMLQCENTLSNLAGEPAIGGIVINSRDVTERNHLARQFEQAQKMEAVGRLAGGVAHDFNNLLTAILGNARLLQATAKLGTEERLELEEIVKASDRAATLTRQLLAFSRKQIIRPVIVDPCAVIQEMERMLHRLLPESIQLETELKARGTVRVDPSQLEQVVMNLVVNARDAADESGRIGIRTADVTLSEAEAKTYGPMARAGEYVIISVEDDGCGIPPSVMSHIFEPFFTTKAKLHGTGLGLSTVYAIVEQAHGWIAVQSVVYRGTRFDVALPLVTDERPLPIDFTQVIDSGPANSETILLVEDEPAVRLFARKTLEREGYRIIEAASGEEALGVAQAHVGPIHLLLTDVLMPGITGARLAELLLLVRPETAVLYMSGYSDEVLNRAGITPERFIQKPFKPEQLLVRVQESLGSYDRTSTRVPECAAIR